MQEKEFMENREKRFLRNTRKKTYPHGIQAEDRILKEEGKTLMGYRDTVSCKTGKRYPGKILVESSLTECIQEEEGPCNTFKRNMAS